MKRRIFFKGGMILLVALFVLFVLTIFSVHFHWFSRQSQFSAHKTFQSELARQISESAYEEALLYLSRETQNSGSAAAKWLIDGTVLNCPNFENSTVIPVTIANSNRLLKNTLTPEISISAKVIEFRNTNSRKPPTAYYGKEGVGTFEISIAVTLKNASNASKEAYCNIVRHHEFKVVGITSDPASRRNSYAHNFILDYVFFFRQGFAEFRDKLGKTLNTKNLQVAVVQPQGNTKGKIYFGGTTSDNRAVYLNIAETGKMAGIIPNLPWQEIKKIGRNECLDLFPKIKAMCGSSSANLLAGLEGKFYAGTYPIIKILQPDPIGPVEDLTFLTLWNSAQGMYRNEGPGLDILSDDPALACDPAYAKSVLEGFIRQRFFYFTAFLLDMSRLSQQETEKIKDYKIWFPCVKEPLPTVSTNYSADMVDYIAQLKNRYGSQDELFSRFVSDYPLLGGQTMGSPAPEPAFPIPEFFDSASERTRITDDSSAFQPFNHVNLWSKRIQDKTDLERLGIIDRANGTINLRGFVWVGDSTNESADKNMIIDIGASDKTYKIRGKGGIITKGASFAIKGKIVKESPGDLLILFTRRGNIEIDTDQPVNAALIAVGSGRSDSGHVISRKKLDLTGMIAAEWLDTESWAKNVVHRIKYDEVLKNGDQYCVNLSSSITFQRISESKL
ncbi:MAG: hypothetical protein HQM10_10595 [Candidatus Riflebacteria bacterium]|nr:hypothetical protein [Candidatus Riflebacteria bacterium]